MKVYVFRFTRERETPPRMDPVSRMYLDEDPYYDKVRYEEPIVYRETHVVVVPEEFAKPILAELEERGYYGPDDWYFEGYDEAELTTPSSLDELFPEWPKPTYEPVDYDDDLPF
ncbi:hypothetical protein P74p10 [Thermus phage P74-26]|uniref:Uncharacterized protein n=1 Tax=Thermus phage P74-26 TaxID=2914007 RepID=A7XXH1_BP742|nr:hypothetical protein P74p10 [Thermus phage P74-26]ABU96960.1 hypothetical protein P74p10 [Thermus phage P74-26]